MKSTLCMLSFFFVFLVVWLCALAAVGSSEPVQLETYPPVLEQIPPGNIKIPVDVTESMIRERNPFFVTFVPREGFSAIDFSILFYDPKGRALAGFLPKEVGAEAFGVLGTWSSFETLGTFTVVIIHQKGIPTITILKEYYLSNRSRGRPIKSFDRYPEGGKDGFKGEYVLNETSLVTWRILDSKASIIRKESHGTRTDNMTHDFFWDRKKDDGNKTSEGDYSMEVVAQPKSDSQVSPDVLGKPIKVTR